MRYCQVAFAAVLVAAALLGAGCPARHALKKSQLEIATVEAFLDAMVADDEAAQAALISPAWLEDEGIDLDDDYEDYRINGYTPTGYKVIGVEDGIVTAEIEFENDGAHRITFLVREEQGRGCIVPGSVEEADDFGDPTWINPWQEVESNIR